MKLYHYTCTHVRAKIGNRGSLIPNATPNVVPLVWLTDLDEPARDALGLSSALLLCDRTAHRYRVTDPSSAHPWVSVRRHHPWRYALEGVPGVLPMHWWVSLVPVPVVYDPIGATV